MLCPTCKTEAAIMGRIVEVSGDESAADETRVYTVLEFGCRNPKCDKFGEVVGTEKHLEYGPGAGQTAQAMGFQLPTDKGGETNEKDV